MRGPLLPPLPLLLLLLSLLVTCSVCCLKLKEQEEQEADSFSAIISMDANIQAQIDEFRSATEAQIEKYKQESRAEIADYKNQIREENQLYKTQIQQDTDNKFSQFKSDFDKQTTAQISEHKRSVSSQISEFTRQMTARFNELTRKTEATLNWNIQHIKANTKWQIDDFKRSIEYIVNKFKGEIAYQINRFDENTEWKIKTFKSDTDIQISGSAKETLTQMQEYRADFRQQLEDYMAETFFEINLYRNDIEAQLIKHKSDTTEQNDKYRDDTVAITTQHHTDTTAQIDGFKSAIEAQIRTLKRNVETQIAGHSAETLAHIQDSRNGIEAQINVYRSETVVKITEFTSDIEGKITQYKRETALQNEQHMDDTDTKIRQYRDDIAAKTNTYSDDTAAQMDARKRVINDLSRQTMLLQFNMEERIRSDGDSGIKTLRGLSKGPENFYEVSIVAKSFNQIHDHSNYKDMCGMGEVIAVLNGVEFRTRHNDYKLRRPSTGSTGYHATEDIHLPEVPQAVLEQNTTDDQILEMREWFKAFKTQNATHRPYTDHFKPVLCYMEGAWTLADGGTSQVDEPFTSDRHHIDAKSWFDLQEKIRFTSYTGTKSLMENLAYLPTTIMSVNETTGVPSYAQWNYRILCSDLKEDIPTRELRLMDDLAFRVPNKKSRADMRYSRGARFRMYEYETDTFTKYSKLDRLFYTIPGKDNIPAANQSQLNFGRVMLDLAYANNTVKMNTGFYHRFFKFNQTGAMGQRSVARGFNDANMWVAQTTQAKVAPVALKVCQSSRNCKDVYTRFSYAIPLEIVYLTPLMTWNPYDIETGKRGYEATDNGNRNGQTTPELAFNGTDYTRYYLTPVAFFNGRTDKREEADTVRKAVGVLDRNGTVRRVTASGVKIILQEIEGVGKVRLRYPIAPLHGEGSAVWKELNAFKNVYDTGVKATHGHGQDRGIPATVSFVMSTTFHNSNPHDHEFTMTWSDFKLMINEGQDIEVETDEAHDHKHTLLIKYFKYNRKFRYVQCDNKRLGTSCFDGHPDVVTITSDNEEVELAMQEKLVL